MNENEYKTKEYMVWFSRSDATEPAIRNFFFTNSNTVRFTRYFSKKLNFLNFINFEMGKSSVEPGFVEKEQRFLKQFSELKEDFVKEVRDNTKYNDIEQGVWNKNKLFVHYFFNLSDKMKQKLNETLLVWWPHSDKQFYGLEDPTFYNNRQMIGSVITHESAAMLNITPDEKGFLIKQGVIFDE
ncbi:MAG: hypothetical protein WDN47_04660 [Candidatus Doudnabacteria bacterium]